MDAATAFALTLAIEVPILLAAWRALGWVSRQWLSATAIAVGVNVTNPLLWLLRPGSWAVLGGAEAVIVVVEGLAAAVCLRRPRSDIAVACLVALVSNAASFLAGLVWLLLA